MGGIVCGDFVREILVREGLVREGVVSDGGSVVDGRGVIDG